MNHNLNDYFLWTALITPLNKDLSVNWDDLEKIVKAQTNARNALLVLGSTGESLNLPLETKKEIVTFVKNLKPSTPIMVGVGGHQIDSELEWIKFLEQQSIDAYLMVTPIYAKAGENGQFQWFSKLMDSVTKPVMLYNVPSRTGSALNLNTVKRLRDHKNFWAIKEASGSVADFANYVEVSGNGNVYSGDDALTDDFCQVGGKGLVSVAANVWPMQTNLYTKKCLEGYIKSNDKEKALWVNSCESLFTNGNPVTPKKLMCKLEQISHDTVYPPLSSSDMEDCEQQLKANENINNWFQE